MRTIEQIKAEYNLVKSMLPEGYIDTDLCELEFELRQALIYNIPLYNYTDYDDFYKHIPYDCRVVAVELNEEARDLKKYIHPERCVYLLGAEDHGIPNNILDKCQDIIMINSNHCMNVAVTGAIVMYDRNIKS